MLILLLTAGGLLPGCVKFKSALTVNPDGSGKMQLRVGMSEQMMQHQDDLDLGDLDELMAQEELGFVAFTRPEEYDEAGFSYVVITGYFEDVNELVMEGISPEMGDEAGADGGTTFAFDGDAGTLTISRTMLGQMAADADSEEMADPQMRAMMAGMMAGLEIAESVTVPGAIAEAGPFVVKGDTASGAITDAELLAEDDETLAKWKGVGAVEIRFELSGWGAGAKGAWEDELAAAKAEWAAMKEEAAATP